MAGSSATNAMKAARAMADVRRIGTHKVTPCRAQRLRRALERAPPQNGSLRASDPGSFRPRLKRTSARDQGPSRSERSWALPKAVVKGSTTRLSPSGRHASLRPRGSA